MTARPTTMRLYTECCPHAVTLYELDADQDRSIFHVGTAAHEVLEGVVNGIDPHDTARRLMTTGREGVDAEPPLPADAVARGLDLARSWLEAHPLPPDGIAEHRVEGHGVSTRIDLVWRDVEEDEDHVREIIVYRDYKSSWQADADELDTMQRRVHAVLAWDTTPDADGVRVEVANLRSRRIHTRTFYRGADDAIIDGWRADIRALADAMAGERRPAPGVRCLGCPYAPVCVHVWDLAHAGGDPVERYAAVEALRDALAPLAKAATEAAPRTLDGGVVGYREQTRRTLRDDAPTVLLTAYEDAAGPAPEGVRDWALGLVGSIAAGVSSVTALGKSIYRGRGSSEPRRALSDAATTETVGRRWGIWRD